MRTMELSVLPRLLIAKAQAEPGMGTWCEQIRR
jgi:hypothetical protein